MKPTPNCEIYIDGASRGNPGPAGIGVVFMEPRIHTESRDAANGAGQSRGQTVKPARQFSKSLGETTNNVAEYLALIYALQEALRHGYHTLIIKSDSELLVRQMNGQYKVRNPNLRRLYDMALSLVQSFQHCSIRHIPREQNTLADRLAGHAADHQGRSSVMLAEQ